MHVCGCVCMSAPLHPNIRNTSIRQLADGNVDLTYICLLCLPCFFSWLLSILPPPTLQFFVFKANIAAAAAASTSAVDVPVSINIASLNVIELLNINKIERWPVKSGRKRQASDS